MESLLSMRVSARYTGGADVLRDCELDIAPGEVVGLVGESGSGKSTVAMTVSRLLEFRGGAARGEVWFQGRDLMALRQSEMRAIRGNDIALVPQSPLSSLNPAMKIGDQIRECWRAHASGGRKLPHVEIADLMAMVNLPGDPAFLNRYPRQLSVGQAQRVLIAMAILHRPKLLIADEPTSALDPESRAGILDLFESLNRDLNISILYVSHDIPSVDHLCHRVIELTPAPVSVF